MMSDPSVISHDGNPGYEATAEEVLSKAESELLKRRCEECIHNKVCAPFLSLNETKKSFDTQFKSMSVEMPLEAGMLAPTCKNFLKPQAGGFLK